MSVMIGGMWLYASYVDPRRAPPLRPVLLALLRASHQGPEVASEAVRNVARQIDSGTWHDLVSHANHEGVLGVIEACLLSEAQVPKAVRESIERRRAIEVLWQDHLLRGLEITVGALTDANIEACALKGPALAARLYPDRAARPSMDLDLLVRAEDLDRSVAALAGIGYSAETGPTGAYLRRYGHHLHFSRPGEAPLELHFRAYAGFGIVLRSGILLERAKPFRFSQGLSVLVPSPEEEFLYLAIHAAGHSFIRLLWLYDLQLLVRRHPEMDWDRVFKQARESGVALVVTYASALLGRWFDVSVPASRHARALGVRAKAADLLLPIVSRPSVPSTRDTIEGLIFMSLLCDRLTSTAWLLQHHALRGVRRRLYELAPRTMPEHWSG